MPEVPLPQYEVSRRRTRTYDINRDNLAEIVAAVRDSISPTGSLQPTLASSAPTAGGWLLCDGGTVSKEDFPSLYAVIGGTYGETADTFTLPDLRGRLPMGIGGDGSPALGAFGGAHQVTLTVDQLPAHDHGVTDPGHTHTFTGDPHNHTVTDPGHTHTAATQVASSATGGSDVDAAGAGNTGSATTGVTVDNATAGGTNSSDTTGLTVDETGGGEPVDNIPPVVGVNWLVKT